ncbi:MAG: hypothetical protein LUQ59_03215 [Methanothrix sp.]|nr:hypothetical protein [Methanothrix sp.]
MNSIMGGGNFRFIRLEKVTNAAIVFCLLSVFFSGIMMTLALAGTETGEFCPTCPDWTDLDGWLAKKEAYEAAQLKSQQNGGQAGSSGAAISKADPKDGYVLPDLITSPSAIVTNGDRILIDVRSTEDYLAGHISGARNLCWKDLQKDGALDTSSAETALSRAAVMENDRLLIYGDTVEDAAMVFWALSYLGHKNLSLLDGGLDAAQDVGVEITTEEASDASLFSSLRPTNYTAHVVPWLLVTSDNLESILGQADVRILDARDFSDYGQNRLGNESICLSLDKIYDGSRIKNADTLKDLFERRLDSSSTVIVYGTPQAYSLFYSLRLMGYNATLLEGGWWKDTKWALSNVN